MKIEKPKKTAPLIIEDVIVDGKKKISVRIESPEDRWREFLSCTKDTNRIELGSKLEVIGGTTTYQRGR